jgi:hypothetical protein
MTPQGWFSETHKQKAYSVETVEALLTAAGLRLLKANEAYSSLAPAAESERISFVAAKLP